MQSLLDTLLLLSGALCTIAALMAGCGKKKQGVMTDMPGASDKTKTGSVGVPPAPPPTAVSGSQKAGSSQKDGKGSQKDAKGAAGGKAPPPSSKRDASDKRSKKVPPAGAAEDDGGYENCKDMTPEELKKALV